MNGERVSVSMGNVTMFSTCRVTLCATSFTRGGDLSRTAMKLLFFGLLVILVSLSGGKGYVVSVNGGWFSSVSVPVSQWW